MNYEFFTDHESVNIDLNYEPEEDECIDLYEPARLGIPRNIGGPLGLRHHPAVINKIARVTFLPQSGTQRQSQRWLLECDLSCDARA